MHVMPMSSSQKAGTSSCEGLNTMRRVTTTMKIDMDG